MRYFRQAGWAFVFFGGFKLSHSVKVEVVVFFLWFFFIRATPRLFF